jgi:hypothetical protein
VDAVVRRVGDDRVVSDAELVEGGEHLSDVLVVVDHRVVVRRLPATRLADASALRVRSEVHVRRVDPREERLSSLLLPLDEVNRALDDLVVDRLHPLLRQRSRVFDRLLAGSSDPAVEDTAGPEPLAEVRILLGVRVIRVLRLLLGVQVVEIAEELVEAVCRRQVIVTVAEVVLPELSGHVAELFE